MTARSFNQTVRRMVDSLTAFVDRQAKTPCPKTTEALQSLRAAVEEEMPVRRTMHAVATLPTRKRKRVYVRCVDRPGSRERKHEQRARRLAGDNEKLRAKLASHTAAKAGEHNCVAPDWMVRVFLSTPSANARGLSKAFTEVVGMDAPTISRQSISRIRDAWVEMYKPMVYKIGADRVAAAEATARRLRIDFVPVFFQQVQDEADIKLRSELAKAFRILSRSRASKVQQSACTLFDMYGSLDFPTELEALGDKTAATLATSFERLLRLVASTVISPVTCGDALRRAATRTARPAPRGSALLPAAQAAPDIWLIHILVGDGIATNNAAAKRLWACVCDRSLGPRVRYLLVVIVCGTHQAGLAAKSAVVGRAAAVARGKLHVDIIGVSVRLYKYLINDYYEEFVFSVNEWVVRDLVVLPATSGDASSHARTVKMQTLYTEHVLPRAMLALWNNGLDRLEHVVLAGQDPEEERPRLVRGFVQWIVQHLMHVDSAPTLSRFFTCRDALDRMFTMMLLGMVTHALQVRKVKPRKESQKRLTSVRNFFKHGEAAQLLRRTALGFQLTAGIEALVSEVPKEGRDPLIVRLNKNAAVNLVQKRLRRIVASMAAGDDPDLDVGAAAGVLFAVAMELILRMERFKQYPLALCRLSKVHFPTEKMKHIHDFLHASTEALDVGCGIQIHKRAWECGGEREATDWLLSEPVQAMLDRLAAILLTNSLEAERRHAQVKKWEGSKLTHISRASGNAIATRFLRWRQLHCQLLARTERDVQKLVRSNVQALIWKQPGAEACRPVGVRFSAVGASSASSSIPYPVLAESDLLAQRNEQLAAARLKMDQLLGAFLLPVTRPQWEHWLDGCLPEFRALMVSAPAARRKGNVRISARPDLPPAVNRIQPVQAKAAAVHTKWGRILQYRTGWYGIKTRKKGVLVVFTLFLNRQTYYVYAKNLAERGSSPRWLLDPAALSIEDMLNELSHLEAFVDAHCGLVTQTFELSVEGAASAEGLCMTVKETLVLTVPVPPPPAAKAGEEDCEVAGYDDDELVVIGSDDESDGGCKVVCSGSESGDEDESDNSSDASVASVSELKKTVTKAFLRMAAATAVPGSLGEERFAVRGSRDVKPPLWSDEYFWIADGATDYVHVRVRTAHSAPMLPQGLGMASISKRIHPTEFGETRDAPVRSVLVLRAWAVWRARQNGWADATSRHKVHIDEQEALIERDVRVLEEPCHLLGNVEANKALLECAPDMVARLLARS